MYCFWHSQILTLSFIFRSTRKTALISKSRDGQRAAVIAKLWGHDVIYGSSSRGGMSGLRQCLRVLGKKRSIVITPDGPRGPREVVKAGIAQIALLSQAQVVPISIFPSHVWRLKSWDSFMIPKPFSKIDIVFGEPLCSSHWGECSVEELRTIIQKVMDSNNVKLAR